MKQDELDQVKALSNALEALWLTYKRFYIYHNYFPPQQQTICLNFLRRCSHELFLYGKIPDPLRVSIANGWVIQLALVRAWIVEAIPTMELPANILRLPFDGHDQDTERQPIVFERKRLFKKPYQ